MMNPSEKRLSIFHAGSLTATFAKINAEFKKLHPDIEILTEAAGSTDAVRRVTEQKRECGVLASADYKLIPEMMFPAFAEWYIIFAADEIVLCYSDKSKYHNEINADNWYEILPREGVTYALHDPDQDPGGYRTLMVWQLAEKHYQIPQLYQKLYTSPGNKILPGNLIALCESGKLDYTFAYRAVAVQNRARYIALPENIDLGNKQREGYYAQAKVEIKGSKQGKTMTLNGEPILFALTVPKNYANQEMAVSWVDFLLSERGIAIMESMGMKPVRPAITNDADKLPEVLKTRTK